MKYCFLNLLVFIIIATSSIICLGGEEKGHICFRVIDVDGDGKVTVKEFMKVY